MQSSRGVEIKKASDKSEASKVFRYWWLISYSKSWIMFLLGLGLYVQDSVVIHIEKQVEQ